MREQRPAAVVGVHGIGNHDDERTGDDAAEALSKTWTEALAAGLGPHRQVDVLVAYYAERLRGETPQGSADIEAVPGAVAVLDRWARALGMPAEQSQGRLTLPARYVLDWIARRFGLDHRMVAWFVTRYCVEVARYLGDERVRSAVRDDVRRVIAQHRPKVVIAHSLGSVVAYEVLAAGELPPVELLVTLGSPLGMPDVVFDRLDPPPVAGLGARPAGVRRWVNIADRGDLVAVPRLLSQRFHGVDADLEVSIAAFDFHRVIRYLACPVTADAVAPWVDAAR
ncbi:hypothetical protein [Dactylosporangium sp. NPDC000521]|uniref:hypothetical protein n=1 Tax=Dactylosporangium sp. NPDC000521 TaxID=3363975 RepID=UPI00367DB910